MMIDDYLKAVTYKQLSFVIKQYGKASRVSISNGSALAEISASALSNKNNNQNGLRCPSIAVLKRKSCHSCGRYGHSKNSHNREESLKRGVKVFDTVELIFPQLVTYYNNQNNQSHINSNNNAEITMTFNMTKLVDNTCSVEITEGTNTIGPLVDDGALYSAMGNVELKLLFDDYKHKLKLEAIPELLQVSTCVYNHQWLY